MHRSQQFCAACFNSIFHVLFDLFCMTNWRQFPWLSFRVKVLLVLWYSSGFQVHSYNHCIHEHNGRVGRFWPSASTPAWIFPRYVCQHWMAGEQPHLECQEQKLACGKVLWTSDWPRTGRVWFSSALRGIRNSVHSRIFSLLPLHSYKDTVYYFTFWGKLLKIVIIPLLKFIGYLI